MATYKEQVLKSWEEWVDETGESAGSPDDFMRWALNNNKIAFTPADIYKANRKKITEALRQAIRVDEDGITYRAKQCAIVFEKGGQIPLWFDTDTGGTRTLRQRAVRQKRDSIANDVYRAMSDVEHMNKKHNENIQFVMDFNDDYRDRKAAEALQNERDEAA